MLAKVRLLRECAFAGVCVPAGLSFSNEYLHLQQRRKDRKHPLVFAGAGIDIISAMSWTPTPAFKAKAPLGLRRCRH